MSFGVHVTRMLGAHHLDIRFAAGDGLTSVFGVSGAGKTSLLDMIAGILTPDRGRIEVAGHLLFDSEAKVNVPVERRHAGYVFQDGRLFPHLSVRDNLLYGQKLARDRRTLMGFDETVAFLGLGHLIGRKPHTLSGGEGRRVAIGRALLAAPDFLLLDEPLSGLDGARRDDVMATIARIRDEVKIPILHVSHDRTEVERLADHIVLLDASGAVMASGDAEAMLTDLSLPLARDDHSASVLPVRVEAFDQAYAITSCRAGPLALLVPGRAGPIGSEVRLRIRASDVSLVAERPAVTSVLNILPATIMLAEAQGVRTTIVLKLENGASLLSRITRQSWDRMGLEVGQQVFAQIKAMALAGEG